MSRPGCLNCGFYDLDLEDRDLQHIQLVRYKREFK